MIDPLDLFFDAARRHVERPAVIEPDGTVTYENLLGRVRRLAHAIAQTGQPHPA
jgi:non-ribosomal peptide synthetase component E (peptide arylation enzyme)